MTQQSDMLEMSLRRPTVSVDKEKHSLNLPHLAEVVGIASGLDELWEIMGQRELLVGLLQTFLVVQLQKKGNGIRINKYT